MQERETAELKLIVSAGCYFRRKQSFKDVWRFSFERELHFTKLPTCRDSHSGGLCL